MKWFPRAQFLLTISVLLVSGLSGCGTASESSDPTSRISSTGHTKPTPPAVSRDVVGTWRGSVWYAGENREWVYTFNKDGTFEDQALDEQGRLISAGSGTYTLDQGRVAINWPTGTQEQASITWVNADQFQYMISSHTDEKQIGLSVGFRRSAKVSVRTAPPEVDNSGSIDPYSLNQQQEFQRRQQDEFQKRQEQARQEMEEHHQQDEARARQDEERLRQDYERRRQDDERARQLGNK